MYDVVTWALTALAVLLVLGWYLSYSAGRLDRLVNLVGELVMNQSRLTQAASQVGTPELVNPVQEIERLVARECVVLLPGDHLLGLTDIIVLRRLDAIISFGDLIIASMYVPNGGKDYPAKLTFLTRLVDWARRLRADGRELLLCGDVNIARTEMDVHPRERKPMAVGQRPEERALFETLLRTGLTDVGRAMDPDNAGLFTWWAPWRNLRARNIGWRLDYLLASPGVATRVRSCVVQADVGTSDHAPVVMTTA